VIAEVKTTGQTHPWVAPLQNTPETKICRITFFSFFSLNVFTIKFFFPPHVENLWTTRTTPVVCDVRNGLKDGFAWGHEGCCNCWLMLLMMLAGWEANRAAYLQAPQPPKMQY
jgi:hypothetical protein